MKHKIIITIAIMLIIVCTFSINVFASNDDYAENRDNINDYSDEAQTDVSPGESNLSDEVDVPSSIDGQSVEAEDNIFATIFEEVKVYFAEILCCLTFLSSILVAFAYKKGLVPIVEGGLGAINRILTKIKEKSDESDKILKDNYSNLESRVSEYEESIAGLYDKVNELTLAIAPFSEELKNNELIEQLIITQTKMLYDVFMASSMPAYQKDRVEAHYKEMMRGTKSEK